MVCRSATKVQKGKILHFPKDRLSLAGFDFPLHDDDKKEDKDEEEEKEEEDEEEKEEDE